MRIFEYLITIENNGDLQLIFPEVRICTANDPEVAKIIAARSIPQEYENRLEDIKILIREFKEPVNYISRQLVTGTSDVHWLSTSAPTSNTTVSHHTTYGYPIATSLPHKI
jgi:hypothetical protein